MMQRIFLFVLIVGMAGCVSSRKHLQRGNYDQAIEKAVKKLSKKPGKEEEQKVLKKAYGLAMEEDRQRIRQLRMSGQPNIHGEIFHIYEEMERRQNLVRRLPSKVLNRIDYEYVNFEKEKVEAQRKAAEYFYANGKKLLQSDSRFDARKAYDEFRKVHEYIPAYKDVDRLQERALAKGKSYVLFTMSNQSNVSLPEGFEEELFKISLSDLNRQWVTFDTRGVEQRAYHYFIDLKLQGINVSPEQIKEREFEEKKIVDDGWEYVLDENGNVKKDSLGNDIKKQKTKEISCRVKETRLLKHTVINGRLEFVENGSGQVIKTEPIAAEWHFEHTYMQAYGDVAALSKKTKKKLGFKPVPFPSSSMMILNAVDVLKEMSRNTIRRHRRLFE